MLTNVRKYSSCVHSTCDDGDRSMHEPGMSNGVIGKNHPFVVFGHNLIDTGAAKLKNKF